MKVLFICNSLEDGKDGIGDYTRKISLECKARDISPLIVALNDKYVFQLTTGYFNDIPYYRIPSQFSISKKESIVKEILNNNAGIDWISIQFVNYGLNPKGIVKEYIGPLSRMLKGYKVHIMMHELWVGEEKQASLKMKLFGKIQKFFILSFLKRIQPKVIQTSIPLYQQILNNYGYESQILPIFSNISLHRDISVDFKKELPEQLVGNRGDYIVCCVFGSIYYDSWGMSNLFKLLADKGKSEGKKVIIASIGKISYGKEFWEILPSKYPDLEFLTLGLRDEIFISNWLNHFVDFGIVTTPALIAGKSGSCMAFFEHGIPVFCKKNELSFNFEISRDLIDKRLIQINGDNKLAVPARTPITSSQIETTVQKFIQTLNNF